MIVTGSILAMGPVLGMLGTVMGMIRAFDAMKGSGMGSPQRLASGIGAALWSTAVGLVVWPIGLALLIGGIVWLGRVNKTNQSIAQAPLN